ncbi:pentatricopeptide repeat-containing protein [Cucumis melo var. makuwa]|uniref:Pentatricopeptide repeat-containing protein n=1 Tax=Cucumis melo var. makuwa TaxID=1194695 RepID=A0A5D3CUE9_CUCMM|nr:pentatricopeptide repeat-containing protein [Cucumis melo var. makuwa]TYK15501.1 pentatricopeptide repeat-containing protein [Cucumis melo var. makuwa]
MDVKTAFLNGDLEEEIYMEQPEGFIVHGQESKVCKLDKSLYGLKQAPKQWHEKFDNLLMSKGFKNTSDSVNQSKHASIIGSLRYVADCTRPDIAYVVGLLCRFTSRPSLEHWNAIERIMRYLKKTQNLGLHYNKFSAVLEGYSDADWNFLSAQPMMESAIITLAAASEEASSLRSLLSEIPTWERSIPTILIHCDSIAAIAKVQNRYYNGKRRQIRRKHSTIKELLTTWLIL